MLLKIRKSHFHIDVIFIYRVKSISSVGHGITFMRMLFEFMRNESSPERVLNKLPRRAALHSRFSFKLTTNDGNNFGATN